MQFPVVVSVFALLTAASNFLEGNSQARDAKALSNLVQDGFLVSVLEIFVVVYEIQSCNRVASLQDNRILRMF